jgi:hypothetical protein
MRCCKKPRAACTGQANLPLPASTGERVVVNQQTCTSSYISLVQQVDGLSDQEGRLIYGWSVTQKLDPPVHLNNVER